MYILYYSYPRQRHKFILQISINNPCVILTPEFTNSQSFHGNLSSSQEICSKLSSSKYSLSAIFLYYDWSCASSTGLTYKLRPFSWPEKNTNGRSALSLMKNSKLKNDFCTSGNLIISLFMDAILIRFQKGKLDWAPRYNNLTKTVCF